MTHHFLVCGGSEVFEFDEGALGTERVQPLWQWDSAVAGAGEAFHTLDECKPVMGGRCVLVTASWRGGVGLLDRGSGKLLSTALSANAHSADLIPGDRVALASSEGTDLVSVYDLPLGSEPKWTASLRHAHGAVWDDDRRVLWALGHDELRCYDLFGPGGDRLSPSLTWSAALPDPNGHDLAPVPGSALLTVTTANGVHLFDRDQRSFAPHPVLGHARHVKAVSVHPTSNRTAYIQADSPNWWSQTVRFLDPEGTLVLPGKHLYKARWCA